MTSKGAPSGSNEWAYEEFHLINAELICAVINYYLSDASVAPETGGKYEPVFAKWGASIESREMCIACDVVARILHGVDHKENEKIDRLMLLGDTNDARRDVWDKMTKHAVPWHGDKALTVQKIDSNRDTVAFMRDHANRRKAQYNDCVETEKHSHRLRDPALRNFVGEPVETIERVPQKAVHPDPENAAGVPDYVHRAQVVFKHDFSAFGGLKRESEERILDEFYAAGGTLSVLNKDDLAVLESWPEFDSTTLIESWPEFEFGVHSPRTKDAKRLVVEKFE